MGDHQIKKSVLIEIFRLQFEELKAIFIRPEKPAVQVEQRVPKPVIDVSLGIAVQFDDPSRLPGCVERGNIAKTLHVELEAALGPRFDVLRLQTAAFFCDFF